MADTNSVTTDRLRKLEPMASLSPSRLAELVSLSYIERLGVGVCLFREGDVDNQMVYLLEGDVQLSSSDGSIDRVVSSRLEEAKFPLDDKQPKQVTAVTLSNVEVLRIDNNILDYVVTWDQLTLPEPAPMAGGQGEGPGNKDEEKAGVPSRKATGPQASGAVPAMSQPAAAPPSAQTGSRAQSPLGSTKASLTGPAGEAGPEPGRPPRRDWVARMRHIMAFRNMPPANVKALLERMERVRVRPGEVVVQQGDEGDYYYVLTDGKARVTRTVELAELEPGATFGEEALISGGERNATVTMETPGVVMRLAKSDFDELLKEPLVDWVSPEEARQLVAQGAYWLDVRHAREYQHQRLPSAINIPLHELRSRIGELDKERRYLCYCMTGRRSSAAAFLLTQSGYKASVLRGGLQVLPHRHENKGS